MTNRAAQYKMKALGASDVGRWGMRTRAVAGLGLALLWGGIGCHRSVQAQDSAFSYQRDADAQQNQPGNGNLAPVDGQYPAQNEAQQQAAQYQQGGNQGAPIERRYAGADSNGYPQDGAYPQNGTYSQNGDPNAAPDDQEATDEAQAVYEADVTGEEASEPPPPLPDYDQPPPPDEDYIWTPGYWAWAPMGYYWVPGVWVEPPYMGALWTPGYWAFYGGAYRFHHGFWGLHIGFYGGIDYGYGYTGYGYYGGYWRGGHFFYNRDCNHLVGGRIVRVYDYHVNARRFAGQPSFNGPRGVMVRPRPAEIAVLHERRYAPLPAQVQFRQQMMQNRQQFYGQNHGRPAVAVESRPVVSNHQMPAALPQAAWRGSANARGRGNGRNEQSPQNRGNWQGNQPAQPQVQPVPQGRIMPQRGGQVYTPRNQAQPAPQQGGTVYTPRSQPQPAPQQSTPQQPATPDFRRGREGRQMQSQPQAQPQVQPQPQPQTRWQQQNNAPAQPGFRRGGWQGQQSQPAPAAQPQVERQQPPARQQNSAPAQAAPQYRRGPEGARVSPPPAQRPQPAPQANRGHDSGHDQGRGRDR